MMTQGIGTQRGMLAAAPSRIAYKPVADRVQSNKAVQNRVAQHGIEDRVESNNSAQSRVNIAA